jgi:intracellular sulfur oxidation DsrE/DsrF family protein
MTDTRIEVARRWFLSRLGLGATTFGATALGANVLSADAVPAQAQTSSTGAGAFQPARHAEDDWLEQPTVKHRFFFDTSSADGFGRALLFANNHFTANRSSYGLADTDLALVICARHESTQFAFTDDMWAKYAGPFAERSRFADPNTKKPATVNVYRASGYGSLPSMGTTLDAVIRRGVRFAVCQMATRATAGVIARSTGGNVDDIYKELTEHLVPNAHMVPAGIVAVNRAQERGYSLATVI